MACRRGVATRRPAVDDVAGLVHPALERCAAGTRGPTETRMLVQDIVLVVRSGGFASLSLRRGSIRSALERNKKSGGAHTRSGTLERDPFLRRPGRTKPELGTRGGGDGFAGAQPPGGVSSAANVLKLLLDRINSRSNKKKCSYRRGIPELAGAGSDLTGSVRPKSFLKYPTFSRETDQSGSTSSKGGSGVGGFGAPPKELRNGRNTKDAIDRPSNVPWCIGRTGGGWDGSRAIFGPPARSSRGKAWISAKRTHPGSLVLVLIAQRVDRRS